MSETSLGLRAYSNHAGAANLFLPRVKAPRSTPDEASRTVASH